MSYRADTLLKRLNKVDAAVFPPESVVAKVRALSPQDRAIYESHKNTSHAWYKRHPGEQAYIKLLAQVAGEEINDPMPQLSESVLKLHIKG